MRNKLIRILLVLLSVISYIYLASVIVKIDNVVPIPYGIYAIVVLGILLIWNFIDLLDKSRWLAESALKNEIKRYKKSNKILNARSKKLASALFFAKIKKKKK